MLLLILIVLHDCLTCVSLVFLLPSIWVCSLELEDPNGSTLSISNPLWDRAARWDEWGADQPRSCLRGAAQHLPADERRRGRCSRGRGLREIASGMLVRFYSIKVFQSAEGCHMYFYFLRKFMKFEGFIEGPVCIYKLNCM